MALVIFGAAVETGNQSSAWFYKFDYTILQFNYGAAQKTREKMCMCVGLHWPRA
jgi:hypothetical protein